MFLLLVVPLHIFIMIRIRIQILDPDLYLPSMSTLGSTGISEMRCGNYRRFLSCWNEIIELKWEAHSRRVLSESFWQTILLPPARRLCDRVRLLPPARRLCDRVCLFIYLFVCLSVCLSVCLWTGFLGNYWMDLSENFTRGRSWSRNDSI